MPVWVRWLFLKKLPSKLCIKPQEVSSSSEGEDEDEVTDTEGTGALLTRTNLTLRSEPIHAERPLSAQYAHRCYIFSSCLPLGDARRGARVLD